MLPRTRHLGLGRAGEGLTIEHVDELIPFRLVRGGRRPPSFGLNVARNLADDLDRLSARNIARQEPSGLQEPVGSETAEERSEVGRGRPRASRLAVACAPNPHTRIRTGPDRTK